MCTESERAKHTKLESFDENEKGFNLFMRPLNYGNLPAEANTTIKNISSCVFDCVDVLNKQKEMKNLGKD